MYDEAKLQLDAPIETAEKIEVAYDAGCDVKDSKFNLIANIQYEYAQRMSANNQDELAQSYARKALTKFTHTDNKSMQAVCHSFLAQFHKNYSSRVA